MLKSLTATDKSEQVVAATLSKFSLPFKSAMVFKGLTLTHREGLIVELTFADGSHGKGEASPLPGFSRESIEDCQLALSTALSQLHALKTQTTALVNYPSAQFALDSALAKIPYDDVKPCSKTTPLLVGSNQQILQSFATLEHPNHIKLKAARQSPEADAELVTQLFALNPKLNCVLDANQSWRLQQALTFAKNAPSKAIAYIEEPCATYEQNMQFSIATNLPIGLDETLQDSSFCFKPHSNIAALIIKPSLIGSFKRCQQLIEQADTHNIIAYLSSSFESPIGLNQLHHLANLWTPQHPAGLETLAHLQPNKIKTFPLQTWRFATTKPIKN